MVTFYLFQKRRFSVVPVFHLNEALVIEVPLLWERERSIVGCDVEECSKETSTGRSLGSEEYGYLVQERLFPLWEVCFPPL
jgi:hypothetical protein